MRSLIDQFGRPAGYLRLSVTDRCDMRCVYCMPESGLSYSPRSEILSFGEIHRLARLFASFGVTAIRVTGGEPLLRRDLPELVSRLAEIPEITDLSLTTNGSRLRELAGPLRRAGLKRINISLDSLDSARFSRITHGGILSTVLDGLEAALRAGLGPVKINMVVMRGLNDDEVIPMLRFAIEKGVELRYLEAMPLGEAGTESIGRFVPNSEVRQRLAEEFDLCPAENAPHFTARAYRVIGTGARVGFISPVSDRFCAICNRIRLSPQGLLQPCLGFPGGVDLKAPLRTGATDEALGDLIREAVFKKVAGNQFDEAAEPIYQVSMSRIGG